MLVTHDMATVQALCHRAMVVHDGEVQFVGDPEDASLRYYRLNFAGPPAPDAEGVNPPGDYVGTVDLNARLVSARLMDENGDRVENVEQRKPISIDVVVEIARELANPTFAFHVRNADGMIVSEFTRMFDEQFCPGQRVRLRGQIENRLVPGSYSLDCWIGRRSQARDLGLQPMRLVQFLCLRHGPAARHRFPGVRHRTDARAADRHRGARAGLLRDVPGPCALGGGWRRSLELLYMISATEFKQTYFGTVLGYLWSLARPLLLFAVLVTVFTEVFHLDNVPHYPVLLLMNIVLFGFFQEATMIAVGSVVARNRSFARPSSRGW